MNYFTSCDEKRGYYLSVTPVKVSLNGAFRNESFMAFSGTKQLVTPAKMFSPKAFQNAQEQAKTMVDNLINQVCEKNGINKVGEETPELIWK